MRAARAVALVLFVVVSPILGVAQRSGVPLSAYARRSNLPAKPDTPLFQFQWSQDPTFATQPLPKMRRLAVPVVGFRRGRPVPAEVEDNVCYTVRSYLVARESRDSDVTVPAGQDTCAAASKFQVKDVMP
jgi:hypothetical protein